jgi:hypothetical protein
MIDPIAAWTAIAVLAVIIASVWMTRGRGL